MLSHYEGDGCKGKLKIKLESISMTDYITAPLSRDTMKV